MMCRAKWTVCLPAGILAITESEGSSSCSTSSMIQPSEGTVCINGDNGPHSFEPLVNNTEIA